MYRLTLWVARRMGETHQNKHSQNNGINNGFTHKEWSGDLDFAGIKFGGRLKRQAMGYAHPACLFKGM